MKKLRLEWLIVLFCCLATRVEANLITNGSFETIDVPSGSWRWFSSDQVEGWSGSNIEIWDSLFAFDAYEGEQYIELNAHPFNKTGFSISQAFDTEVGREYEVKFAYSARNSIREMFRFKLYSSMGTLINKVIKDHQVRQWQQLKMRFTANYNRTALSFTSVNPMAGTVGNLIDDVGVNLLEQDTNQQSAGTKAVSVSEPVCLSIFTCFFMLLMRKQLG